MNRSAKKLSIKLKDDGCNDIADFMGTKRIIMPVNREQMC